MKIISYPVHAILQINEIWALPVHRIRNFICHPRHTRTRIPFQNLAVIIYHPLATSGKIGTYTETCGEQSTEFCREKNLASAECLNRRMRLQKNLRLSSDLLLQQLRQRSHRLLLISFTTNFLKFVYHFTNNFYNERAST